MEVTKDLANVGKSGVNIAIWAGSLFIGAAIVFAGWNWSKKRAEEKENLA